MNGTKSRQPFSKVSVGGQANLAVACLQNWMGGVESAKEESLSRKKRETALGWLLSRWG
jgi:hypothetical protein